MADQQGRPSFRFRLPWVISAAAAAQAPPSRAPEAQPSAATSAPLLRPPFRPPGPAPPRPFIPRAESMSIPPSRVVSQPSSPTRPFQPAQVVSLPPSPARTATAPTSRAGSQPPSPPPKPTPQPSPTRPVTDTSPPPPTPEDKSISHHQPPQLPSPSKIAAQFKSQEIHSPVLLGIPRSQQPTPRSVPQVEKKAQSPPPLSLPPPALPPPQQERERKTETASNGAIRPTTTTTAAAAAAAAAATLMEPQKPRFAPTEEPEQRTISELPSTNQDKKTLIGRRVVAGAGDPLGIPKDRSPPSPQPPPPPPTTTISESQQNQSQPKNPPFQKNIKEEVSRLVHKYGPKHLTNSAEEESPVSVITLAGENKGATMQLGPQNQFPKKEGPVHIHRGYKLGHHEHHSESKTTDGDSSSRDDKKSKNQNGKSNNKEETKTSKSFVNSNVQGINNSIMFSSSYSERSPGVHLTLSRSVGPASEGPTTVEARRADFRAIEAQKLTYEPTVRRRCLRGLFSEPIESDPDNPGKARRHGCRYNCSPDNRSDGN
ncbi:hypothetical protein Syun_005070 [Stephania yunnanensis]|uniref:Uncharacterized protein n=1 Tax=Stephania yunnanensis TaxID=152371 RepID=A0AAP0Q1W1_9MAGN